MLRLGGFGIPTAALNRLDAAPDSPLLRITAGEVFSSRALFSFSTVPTYKPATYESTGYQEARLYRLGRLIAMPDN